MFCSFLPFMFLIFLVIHFSTCETKAEVEFSLW
uniref:Uncharacterized protein n=1 Tax=Rhizophora mucronata TaxID=61149 RepID=A0A2P2N628_RHIMU